MKRLASLLLLAAVAFACGGTSPQGPGGPIEWETGRRAAVTGDGLHRVKARHIAEAYLRPGASFTGYRSVLIEPVEVFYKHTPASPRGRSGPGNYALEPKDLERLRGLFREALVAEFEKSALFSVVTERGPGVLRVRTHLVDLVVHAPPEHGRDRVFIGVAGELTLILDVSDSVSLQPLARLHERRQVQPSTGPFDSLGAADLRRAGFEWGELRRMFRRWAAVLRAGLEELPTRGPVPSARRAVGERGSPS